MLDITIMVVFNYRYEKNIPLNFYRQGAKNDKYNSSSIQCW